MKKQKKALFKFQPFSRKQRKILNWWCDDSPVKNMDGIIADGAIRSGKTVAMSLSFVMWAMTKFENQNFGMCGKTIGSFRRNVLFWLKLMLKSRGYTFKDHRSDNMMVIKDKSGKENYFYIFGGKDERSQDLVQGITLAGVFFDEVALMPESFVNQATGRCSVEGSKFWFNCNPDGPKHWFKLNWIDKRMEKRLIYLHFTMDDNLSLSAAIKERYKAMYVGVFYQRYILGLWVAAEGVIFRQLADDPSAWEHDDYLPAFKFISIGVDIGGTRSHSTLTATGITHDWKMITFGEDKIEHAKGMVSPDVIYNRLETFVKRIEAELTEDYKAKCKAFQEQGKRTPARGIMKVQFIFVDNAEQVILNGVRRHMVDAGFMLEVTDCRKVEGKTRILAYHVLLNTHRMSFRNVPLVVDALSTVLYDEKKHDDTILDDFTTDVDTFDSHFYSWSYFIDYFGAFK